MNLDLLLAQCLEEIAAGASVEQCLARHESERARLEAPLRAAAALLAARPSPEPAFKERLKSDLLRQYLRPVPDPVTKSPLARLFGWTHISPRNGTDWSRPRRRMSMAAIAAVIALLVSLMGGGLTYASQGALPGQTLYPVKGLVEAIRVSAARDSTQRALVRLRLADGKLDEAAKILEDSSAATDGAAVATALQAYDEQIVRLALELQANNDGSGDPDLEQAVQARVQHQVPALERVQALLQERIQAGANTGNALQAISQAIADAKAMQERLQQRFQERDHEGQPTATATLTPSPEPSETATATATPTPRGTRERDRDQDRDQDQEHLRTGTPRGVTPTCTPGARGDEERATPTPGGEAERNREQNGEAEKPTLPPTGQAERNREQNGSGSAPQVVPPTACPAVQPVPTATPKPQMGSEQPPAPAPQPSPSQGPTEGPGGHDGGGQKH